jgi:hypothetical protein
MKQDNDNTAAVARIEDVADCMARADAQVRSVLQRVMAQRRSAAVAFDYVAGLSPGARANCWSIAESAGHEGWGRMQALLGSYRWNWRVLRTQLPGLAAAWIPDLDGDLIGPGIAIDETAQLKHGDATACVAPQHAGCTGQVENCPARRSRQAVRRRADLPSPPRLRAALVCPATAAPGHRPLASLQRPAARCRDRVTSSGQKEVTECNTITSQGITLSGNAATHRETATVVRVRHFGHLRSAGSRRRGCPARLRGSGKQVLRRPCRLSDGTRNCELAITLMPRG